MTCETTSTLPLSPLKAWRRPDVRANGAASVTRYGQIFLRLRDALSGLIALRSRVSQGGVATDPRKLADRATAHELILGHAKLGGIPSTAVEMQDFARQLFSLSRQCGAAGLEKESKRLFYLARTTSLPHRAAALDFRIYERTARTIGWTAMGRIASHLDKFRKWIPLSTDRL
jgi:hypothetical protein